MKSFIYLFVLITLISLTQSACNKSETSKQKTRLELLTQKPWILAKWRYSNMGGPWIDEFAKQPACSIDDILTFETDQSCVKDLGAIKCYQDSPQFLSGKWRGIEGYISLINVGFDETFTFIQLDENTLMLRGSRGVGINDEYTFVHP